MPTAARLSTAVVRPFLPPASDIAAAIAIQILECDAACDNAGMMRSIAGDSHPAIRLEHVLVELVQPSQQRRSGGHLVAARHGGQAAQMDDGTLVELVDRLLETPRLGVSRDENSERLRRDRHLDRSLESLELAIDADLDAGRIRMNGERHGLPPGECGRPAIQPRSTVGNDDPQCAGVESGASGEVGGPDERYGLFEASSISMSATITVVGRGDGDLGFEVPDRADRGVGHAPGPVAAVLGVGYGSGVNAEGHVVEEDLSGHDPDVDQSLDTVEGGVERLQRIASIQARDPWRSGFGSPLAHRRMERPGPSQPRQRWPGNRHLQPSLGGRTLDPPGVSLARRDRRRAP